MQPWISYRAAAYLARTIRPDWTAIEFGSGTSTVWLARRCASVLSIEHDPGWYAEVSSLLHEHRITNVRLELRDADQYCDLSDVQDKTVDFALVDGISRAACVSGVIEKIRPGGLVYLDNADRVNGDYDGAVHRLLQAMKQRRDGMAVSITDFAPMSFVATRGILARL